MRYVAAVIIALSFFVLIYNSVRIFEKLPHSQDEVAYIFQAKIFHSGRLYLESFPQDIRRFFDNEFIINDGKWYGKYSPGTSIFLAIGMIFGAPWLINPIFGLLSLVVLYKLVTKLYDAKIALLTLAIFAVSPFFLLLNATYMSHAPALFLTLVAVYGLFNRKYLYTGAVIGLLFLTRPYNTLPLLVLASIYVLYIIFRDKDKKLSPLLYTFAPFGIALVLHAIYNYFLTGSPLTFPMNAYFDHDTVGFGPRGVEWTSDFTPQMARNNLIENFKSLKEFFFSWQNLYLLIMMVVAYLGKYWRITVLLSLLFLLQVGAYFFYFHPGTFLGPRYWFEVSWILALLTALGIITGISSFFKPRFVYFIVLILTVGFVTMSYKLNWQFMSGFKSHNGMTHIEIPTDIPKPAIAFTRGQDYWQQYSRYFIMMSVPIEGNDIIFARDKGIHNVPKDLEPLSNNVLVEFFPGRSIYQLKSEEDNP